MLTALGGIDEKAKGFEAGADDYLLKPFEVRELVLRIKALLKRASQSVLVSPVYQIADLVLNPEEKKASRSGKIINLSAKEYKLLEYMIINKNKVLDRIELMNHVWGLNFDSGTNVIDVYVNFLRKKIDNNFEVKLIHTRIGLGYILTDEQD
jgi:DNA-binding response OmpR family regulator